MKTTIYYFSGTGNSLAAARRIASQLEPCALVPVTEAGNRHFRTNNTATSLTACL